MAKTVNFKALRIFISLCLASSLAKGAVEDPVAKLISQGVHQAFDLQTQRLSYEQAVNNERNSYSSLLPTVTLAASKTFATTEAVNSTTQTVGSTVSSTPAMSATANWTIWNNYANIRAVQLAGKSREAAYESGAGGLSQYVLGLLTAYFNYQSALMTRDILKAELDQARQTYKQALTLVQAGARTKLDSVDAEIDVLNNERNLMEAENGLKASMRNLGALLNNRGALHVPDIDLLAYRPYYMDKFEEVFPGLRKADPFVSSRRNPTMTAAQISLDTQELTFKQAKLAYFPTTSIAYTHTYTMDGLIDPTLAGGLRTGLNTDQIAVSLTWQVWDWFSTYRTIDNAEKDYKKSMISFSQTKLATATDLQNVIEQYDVLEKSIQATELAVRKAQEQFEYSQTMYRLGRIDLLMMQQSVSRLATAKRELASRLTSKYILAAQILFSSGHQIQPVESEPDWLKKI